MRSDSHAGRSYAPIGETPVRLVSGSRFSTNMISTVTNRGKLRFMLYRETLPRSEEHTSELQSLMRISYAVFCLQQKNSHHRTILHRPQTIPHTTKVSTHTILTTSSQIEK